MFQKQKAERAAKKCFIPFGPLNQNSIVVPCSLSKKLNINELSSDDWLIGAWDK